MAQGINNSLYYKAMHKKNGRLYLAYDFGREKGVLKIDTKKKEYTDTVIPELENLSVKVVKTADGFEFFPDALPDLTWPDSNLDIRFAVDMLNGEVTVTSGDSNENTTISEGTYSSFEPIASAVSGANYGAIAYITGEESITGSFGNYLIQYSGNFPFVVIRESPIRMVNKASDAVVRLSYRDPDDGGPATYTVFDEVSASLGTYTFTVPSNGDANPVTNIAGVFVGDGVSASMGGLISANEGEVITINWAAKSYKRVIFSCMEFERAPSELSVKSAAYNIDTEEVTVSNGELTLDVESSGNVPVVYGVGNVKYYSAEYSVGNFSIELDFGDGYFGGGGVVSWLVNPEDILPDAPCLPNIRLYDYEISSYLNYDGDNDKASGIYNNLMLGSFFCVKSNEVYFLNSKNMSMIELTEGIIYDLEGGHDLSEINTCYFSVAEDSLLFFSSECIDIFKGKALSVLDSPETFYGLDNLQNLALAKEKNNFFLYLIETFDEITGKYTGHTYKIESGEIKHAYIEMPETERFLPKGVYKNYVYGSHITESEETEDVFVQRLANYEENTISESEKAVSDKIHNVMYGYVINKVELPYRG